MKTALIDSYGRRIEYLRLSVADKCNMRCFYCLPKGHKQFERQNNWLTFDETERVVHVFADLGVSHLRITGGEPLIRADLPVLTRRLMQIPGIEDLSLSTNATLLERDANGLYQSGVTRLNVSLDSLNETRFKEITGGSLEPVLAGLRSAKLAGFKPIKINMVVMKGINEAEIEDMVRYCRKHGFILRLIETMPMGDTGRNAVNQYVDLAEVRKKLQRTFDLVDTVVTGGGPARYMRSREGDFCIGFITPLSQHFCANCNRVRLSVGGTLYTCLGQEHSLALRPLLRDGINDHELKQVILDAIEQKPEKHNFNEEPETTVRFMSMTGG